ncbi:MAG TPA: pseudaminic acid synthase [Terriglobales bacterium]|nr:pseudaminic acid synthase [Terriglobales bacterium]
MIANLKIGERLVGPGQPAYVVAEISANHNQNFEQAVRLLHASKAAGADAVKLQTYTADTITIRSDREYFRISGGTLWDGRILHDLYAEASTPWEWQPRLKDVADDLGLDLFSSPFDSTAVDFLEGMGVPAYKLASCELVDIALIQKMAKTLRPLILSTGMATVEEIEEALNAAADAGCTQVALLKCTAAYPALADEMNLRTIPEMARRFQVPVGLSDHTMGVAVPVAAVALGACIIEKHITLSRSLPGPDSAFSLEPEEFKFMVEAVRIAEKSLGKVQFGPSAHEKSTHVFRRSLFIVEDVKQGETLTPENVRSIRPGHGLHTRHLAEVIGKRAVRNIERGTPVTWDLIEN